MREAIHDALGRAYATGRRKCSSARVWVFPGDGRVSVNGVSLVEYFRRASHVDEICQPFLTTSTSCEFDVKCTVKGGGLSGQAGAVRLGVARALQVYDPEQAALRDVLEAHPALGQHCDAVYGGAHPLLHTRRLVTAALI